MRKETMEARNQTKIMRTKIARLESKAKKQDQQVETTLNKAAAAITAAAMEIWQKPIKSRMGATKHGSFSVLTKIFKYPCHSPQIGFKAYPAALAGSGSRFADRSVDPQWCLGLAEGQHAALRGLDVQSWGEPRQGHIWRQLRNSSPPPIVKYYNVALSFVHRV